MAGTFQILTHEGKKDTEGTIIKMGKGKKAYPVLGIRKDNYSITHLISGVRVSTTYEYLSQAKIVAGQIIEHVGNSLLEEWLKPDAFSYELQIYIETRWYGNKSPPSLEEWISGPDYEEILQRIHSSGPDNHLSQEPEAKYVQELQGWDCTIAWVPRQDGPVSGQELQRLIEGRPFRR